METKERKGDIHLRKKFFIVQGDVKHCAIDYCEEKPSWILRWGFDKSEVKTYVCEKHKDRGLRNLGERGIEIVNVKVIEEKVLFT